MVLIVLDEKEDGARGGNRTPVKGELLGIRKECSSTIPYAAITPLGPLV